MGLYGPGGVPLPPMSQSGTPPDCDINAAIPVTMMLYPRRGSQSEFAIVIHWRPDLELRLVRDALAQCVALTESMIAQREAASQQQSPNGQVPGAMACGICGSDPHKVGCPAATTEA